MKPLAIIGVGGLGRMTAEIVAALNAVAPHWRLDCFLDDNPTLHGKTVAGLPVAGPVRQLASMPDHWAVVAVAQTSVRRRIATGLAERGFERFATLVHPTVWIGSRTTISPGAIIYPGAIIDCDVVLGPHAVLNKGCTVGHDTVLGSYVTVAPGVNLGGDVQVGDGVDLGIGSCTVQGISIGAWSVVGAGAAVVANLPPNVTAVGVPARPIKERSSGWHTL